MIFMVLPHPIPLSPLSSGSGETVTINGEATNSKCVSINKYGQTIISVEIGDTAYQLTIHNDAAPPVTEPETKPETKPTTEVTVTFDANGGSVTPSSATTKGGKLESLPTPTYDGYDFPRLVHGKRRR